MMVFGMKLYISELALGLLVVFYLPLVLLALWKILLQDAGIQSIATGHTGTALTDSHGNQHRQQGSFTRADGSSGQMEDIWFRINASSTRQDNPLDVSAAIHDMPNIAGLGNVGSLWQVMGKEAQAGSSHLMDLVTQFANETDQVARQALTVKIIYAWAGGVPIARRAARVGGGGTAMNDKTWRRAA